MAVNLKAWAIRSIGLVLILSVPAGVYQVWVRTGVRTHPWQLEACLESRLADCRTGWAGLAGTGSEYEQIAARAEAVRQALVKTDRQWAVLRDYSPCIHRILALCMEAQLLTYRLAVRSQEQNTKLEVLLATLKNEFETRDRNGTLSPKLRIQSLDQSRAKSLVEQAEYLRSHGEVESALETVLRAWSSWHSFNNLIDNEFARFQDTALRAEWNRQARELLIWTKERGRRAILIDKLDHRCLLLSGGQIEKSYSASLGRNWYVRKVQEHDAATPEGKYRVVRMITGGKYGMALLLDYPNAADRTRFAALKRDGTLYPEAHMGGNVEIHGAGRPDSDWTDGCVSLNNNEMQDLYRYAYRGMPVTIVGTAASTNLQRDGTLGSR